MKIKFYFIFLVGIVFMNTSLQAQENKSEFPQLTQVGLLARALSVFAAPLETAEIDFHMQDGSWHAPDSMLDAYRSRLAYARQVDEELQEKSAKKRG